MNDADLTKILTDVKEGLVVHPGDHLILSFPANSSPQDLQEMRDRLWERFIGAGIEVTLVTAVTQLAVIRREAS